MWIKEEISKLHRTREVETDRTGMFRMDRNERTIPFEESFMGAVKDKLSSEILTNYPNENGLYDKLVAYLGHGLSTDNLIMHTGSDLVIKSIFETYIEKNDRVLLHKPSYAMYEVYSNMFGAELCAVEYNDNLEFDLQQYTGTIKSYKPKLAILENPNGFIGNFYNEAEVRKFVEACMSIEAIAIVDEAYIDFCNESIIGEINNYDNLIIVRTFSKAWGLAGLRVGYALANNSIIRDLDKSRPMHQFTGFSALVCELLLNYDQHVNEYINQMKMSREYTINEFKRLKIPFVYGETNFITAKIGAVLELDEFRKICKDEHFLLRRPFREEKFKEWLRIGLLDIDNMKRFIYLVEKCKRGGEFF